MDLLGLKVGFAVCGSFCTYSKAFSAAENLVNNGCILTPIMSFNSQSISSRFGKAEDNIRRLEEICGNKIIGTIEDAEPVGPKKLFDVLVIAPCTGNTLAKLAVGITDTPVTMAVKSHLRNLKPVVIAIATNDALAGSAKNIGQLMNYRNYYFVPYSQDDSINKPCSLISDYSLIAETIQFAVNKKQIQPIILK